MTGSVQPYCNGMGCPLKLECGRYKPVIDYKKEQYLAYAPYSHIEKKCTFKPNDPVQEAREIFIDHLKKLNDGD